MSMTRNVIAASLLLGAVQSGRAEPRLPEGSLLPAKPVAVAGKPSDTAVPAAGRPVPAQSAAPAAPTERSAAAPSDPTPAAKSETPAPTAVVPKLKLGQVDTAGAEQGQDIDFSALRYYVAQKDAARVNAEIRLLHKKYPKWRPSGDLIAQLKDEEIEQPLWDFYSKHDFVTLRSKMAEIQTSKPQWHVSARLLAKLALGEARDGLIKASNSAAWADVGKIAANNPLLLNYPDLDVLWRAAEALAHLGDQDQATSIYRYVLQSSKVPAERLSTVQKAALLLKADRLSSLFDLGARDPDGHGEFEQVQLDLDRTKIGTAASGASTVQPTPAEIEAIARSFSRSKSTDDAQLLGWYAYSRKNLVDAEAWFRKAMAVRIEAKSAEGLVLVLRDEGKLDEAQQLAFESRDLGPLNRSELIWLYMGIILGPKGDLVPQDRVAALAAAVEGDKSSDGAQAMGWYRYKRNDFAGAQSWFRKSADWKENESAAVGLLVCASRLKQESEFMRVAHAYGAKFAHVAKLEAAIRPRGPAPAARGSVAARPVAVALASPKARKPVHGRVVQASAGRSDAWDKDADEIVNTFQNGGYDKALAMLDARKQTKAEPKGLTMVRGWTLYHRGDWTGARKVFTDAASAGQSTEAQSALRVLDTSETPQRFR